MPPRPKHVAGLCVVIAVVLIIALPIALMRPSAPAIAPAASLRTTPPVNVTIFSAGNATGDMGGLAGADAMCAHARPGGCTARALLCASGHSIGLFPTYFDFNVSAPVFRNGSQIADSWLPFSILLPTTEAAWSGCGGILGSTGGLTCDDWANSSALGSWGAFGASMPCSGTKELLCVCF
jgi:hypothetical protein